MSWSTAPAEQTWLEQVRSRPALADPAGILPGLEEGVLATRQRLDRAITTRLAHGQRDLDHLRARSRTLSPLATLDRGYAVVIGPAGWCAQPSQLGVDDEVRVRVSSGNFAARVTDVASDP